MQCNAVLVQDGIVEVANFFELILFDLIADRGGCEKIVGAFIPSAFRHSQCTVHNICTTSASFWG